MYTQDSREMMCQRLHSTMALLFLFDMPSYPNINPGTHFQLGLQRWVRNWKLTQTPMSRKTSNLTNAPTLFSDTALRNYRRKEIFSTATKMKSEQVWPESDYSWKEIMCAEFEGSFKQKFRLVNHFLSYNYNVITFFFHYLLNTWSTCI